jgi:hypothetical protein
LQLILLQQQQQQQEGWGTVPITHFWICKSVILHRLWKKIKNERVDVEIVGL